MSMLNVRGTSVNVSSCLLCGSMAPPCHISFITFDLVNFILQCLYIYVDWKINKINNSIINHLRVRLHCELCRSTVSSFQRAYRDKFPILSFYRHSTMQRYFKGAMTWATRLFSQNGARETNGSLADARTWSKSLRQELEASNSDRWRSLRTE